MENCPEQQPVCLSMLPPGSAAAYLQQRSALIWVDLRAARLGSLASPSDFCLWFVTEILRTDRSGFAFQSCLCEQVGWSWDGQCRSSFHRGVKGLLLQTAEKCFSAVLWEKRLECIRLRAKESSALAISTTIATVQNTGCSPLAKACQQWNLPLSRNCWKSSHCCLGLSLAVPLGSSVLPEMCQEENRKVSHVWRECMW